MNILLQGDLIAAVKTAAGKAEKAGATRTEVVRTIQAVAAALQPVVPDKHERPG